MRWRISAPEHAKLRNVTTVERVSSERATRAGQAASERWHCSSIQSGTSFWDSGLPSPEANESPTATMSLSRSVTICEVVLVAPRLSRIVSRTRKRPSLASDTSLAQLAVWTTSGVWPSSGSSDQWYSTIEARTPLSFAPPRLPHPSSLNFQLEGFA